MIAASNRSLVKFKTESVTELPRSSAGVCEIAKKMPSAAKDLIGRTRN